MQMISIHQIMALVMNWLLNQQKTTTLKIFNKVVMIIYPNYITKKTMNQLAKANKIFCWKLLRSTGAPRWR